MAAATTEDQSLVEVSSLDAQWARLRRNINLANTQSKTPQKAEEFRQLLAGATNNIVESCRVERKRMRDAETPTDIGDEAILKNAAFTDTLALDNYEHVLHLVPRLVNIVTLAEAVPVPGSGLKLPLDLHQIGSRCSNSYYAPRRFAAVQLAFDSPRCRVLVFRTLHAR